MECSVAQIRNLGIIVDIFTSVNFNHSRDHFDFYLQYTHLFPSLHQIQCHRNSIKTPFSP